MAAQGHSVGLCRGVARVRAWVRPGTVGRSKGRHRGAAWGDAGAQREATLRRSVGLCKGEVWDCAGEPYRAVQGHILRLCRCVAWDCVGPQRGVAMGGCMRLRKGHRGTAWGCAGVQS